MTSPFKNKVLLKDVVQGLKALPAASADVLIADAPYNIGKDFGNNKDSMPLDKYVEWSKSWMAEGMRVLKPTGTFYVYGFSEILAHLFVAGEAEFKRWLVWHYANKNAASLHFWQRSHESIVLMAHQKPTFNEDDVREPYSETYLKNAVGKTRAGTLSRFNKGGKETVYSAHENGALPRDVLKHPALAGGAGARERAGWCRTCDSFVLGGARKLHAEHDLFTHPTQKPLELSQRLVRAAKNKHGDTNVVVLFSGSGAECVAARREGCNVVGFDINPEFVKMANAWLDRA